MSINVTVVGSTGVNASIASSDSVLVSVGGTIFGSPAPSLLVEAGANITVTTASGSFTIIGRDIPVASVNGKTGTVLLTNTDVSAASAAHTHVAANISNLTSVANVVSVNGITGTPVIVGGAGVTVSTAGSSITIEASGGTGGGGASLSNATPSALGAASAGSSGLASRADHIHAMPSADQVGAASAVHTHVASDITNLTSVANVVSVNAQTGLVSIVAGANVTISTSAGSVTIAAPAPGDALPSQGGNANRLLATNGTAASWATRYSVVEPVLVAGGGIAFSKDTSAGQVTIESLGGIVGSTAASVSTKVLAFSQNDYDAGVADIVRISPSADITLTGLSGGVNGVVRVLYNVGTHVVTLANGATTSQATNRFSISSGNIGLEGGDSASVWYDGTSQRWRVLEDQTAGGGGGGIAMSYLFG